MVGGDDEQGIRVLIDEGEDGRDGLVKGDLIANRGGAIVTVRGMVDASAFDHQEEPFGRRAKALERDLSHLRERGRGSLEFGGIEPVDLEGDMALAEEAEQRSLARISQELIAGECDTVASLAVISDEVITEVHRAAAKDDVHATLEILGRDSFLVGTAGDGGGEACRRCVRGGRGGDEAAALLGGVHLLHQSDGRAAVRRDIQDAVIDALADAPAAGGGGGVGHDSARRVGLAERTNDGEFAVHLHPMRGTLLGAGEVGLRSGEHREAHTVGDHEDHVLGLALGGVGGGLAAVGTEGSD